MAEQRPKKFTIRLKRDKSTVYMKCPFIHEKLRGLGEIYKDLENGITFASCSHPELLRDIIYLRGDESLKDNDLSKYVFQTEEKAIRFIESVKKSLANFERRLNEKV